MAETATTPRLKARYHDEIKGSLFEQFGYANVMQVPGVVKVVVNMGVGDAAKDSKLIEGAVRDLTAITGQKPVVTKARKSIAQFKLREGMPIGTHTTLRGDRMWEFLDRLVSTALPRIRDFRGLSPKQFDGRGNYTFGLTEQSMFHEIDQDKIDRVRGMDITVVTTATNDDGGARAAQGARLPVQGELSNGQDCPRQQGEQEAEVRGPRLHALPALRPSALGLPQVRPVPDLPAGDGPPRRAARCDQVQLVTRRDDRPPGRRPTPPHPAAPPRTRPSTAQVRPVPRGREETVLREGGEAQ